MQCDKCGSDNTQRLEVVFQNGTSNINTASHSAGVGLGGGALGIGGVTTKTTGTSQTMMGEKATPPSKKSYKWAMISIVFGWIFLNLDGPGGVVFGGALIIGGAYFIYNAFTYNKKEWPTLYKNWQECWLCHKCGNIYHRA